MYILCATRGTPPGHMQPDGKHHTSDVQMDRRSCPKCSKPTPPNPLQNLCAYRRTARRRFVTVSLPVSGIGASSTFSTKYMIGNIRLQVHHVCVHSLKNELLCYYYDIVPNSKRRCVKLRT